MWTPFQNNRKENVRNPTRPESSAVFKKKYLCFFLSWQYLKYLQIYSVPRVSFLTGEEAEMKSEYLAGLFDLTLLVFWETLTVSATDPAFPTKQAPNLGFPGESKAVQSSQTTRRCPGWSISPGGLKTRLLVLPVHTGEEGDVRTCVSVSSACGCGGVGFYSSCHWRLWCCREGRPGLGRAGLVPLSLCCCGHFKTETERDFFLLAEKQIRGN